MKQQTVSKFDKVMVIDDKEIDLFVTERLALICNFCTNLLGYRNAEDAFMYLEKNQDHTENLPEVILVDMEMPIMDCFAFLDVYDNLSDALKEHCRVFVISASLDYHKLTRVKSNVHVKGFLEKPVTWEHLNAL